MVESPSLKVKRPEIYYGETMAETVFVRTSQPEFNYPSGASEVNTRYDGKGGFPMSSLGDRALATVSEGDWNILLTNALTPESRMMIHRNVVERLTTLAPFLSWDEDPYMVTTEDGRLVWMVDGYTTSDAHPYARPVAMENLGRFNYIRNSVKATIDAYDGDVHLYVFDTEDPLIRAYEQLFPDLFTPAAAMPAGLRAHARAPEMLFRAQAEIYRTYHMRDPESYYNRADLWDLATFTTGAQGPGAKPQVGLGRAPTWPVAVAAAVTALRTHSSRSRPRTHCATKPAQNASPAPVESTISAGRAAIGTRRPSPAATSAPSAPSLSATTG